MRRVRNKGLAGLVNDDQGRQLGRKGPLGVSGTPPSDLTQQARRQLVEVGGRTSKDLGLGRIVGQLLVYLYLWDGDCSLDQICEELRLSKAAVSIAARQLEGLGLIRRTWRPGDRKKYYRTADTIGVALRQGLLHLVRSKVESLASELDATHAALKNGARTAPLNKELQFLATRVGRAKVLRDHAATILGNPLLRLLVPAKT
ncbi:MAG: MarR family transcriptional regulator [Verrucomicrobia bacterium]|nr:MAG: MarR family transcriptional regulator [Verrucomicrobiota bacterium]